MVSRCVATSGLHSAELRTMKNSSAVLLLGVFATVLVLLGVVLWVVLDRSQDAPPPPGIAAASSADDGRQSLQRQRATQYQQAAVERAIRPGGLIDRSIDRFRLRMGAFPLKLEDIHRRPDSLQPDQRWDGPYINNPRLLRDPWNQPYQYRTPGVHNESSYDLWSKGADGTSGTADDIGNW